MELLQAIRDNVICGKVNLAAKYPPDKRGQPGVVEQVEEALKQGIEPAVILREGLMAGMEVVGRRFKANEVYVTDVMISAKAMKAGMELLRPFFSRGGAPTEGMFIIGTVQGDHHDIGKNLVCMMLERAGVQGLDLGVDVPVEKFIAAVREHPGAVVGMSALLTTTMLNMKKTLEAMREAGLKNPVIIGGAPVSQQFCEEIAADAYAPDPYSAVEQVRRLIRQAPNN